MCPAYSPPQNCFGESNSGGGRERERLRERERERERERGIPCVKESEDMGPNVI